MKRATEEFLRWTSPAPALARTVTTETELGRQKLCPGDRLLLSWASANQDADTFDDPEEVNIDRWPNRHAALGWARIAAWLQPGTGAVPGGTQGRAAQAAGSQGGSRWCATVSVAWTGKRLLGAPATFTPTDPIGVELPLD